MFCHFGKLSINDEAVIAVEDTTVEGGEPTTRIYTMGQVFVVAGQAEAVLAVLSDDVAERPAPATPVEAKVE